jgi:anti-anti-sigma factor
MRPDPALVSPRARRGYFAGMTAHDPLQTAGVESPPSHDLPSPRAPSESDLGSRTRWKSADAVVVEVTGDIDLCTVARFAAILDDHVRARPGVLRVDLGQVRFLGAAGIRVLRQAERHAGAVGVHFVVDPGGSRPASRALELLGHLPGR